MITSLRLVDFKNFADETLRLGPFTVLVGANAAGKSNIRDAFRVLHGIGCGYSLDEVFGGKFVSGQQVWEPIRGGPNGLIRRFREEFSISTDFQFGNDIASHYISFCDPGEMSRFIIWNETIKNNDKVIFESDADNFHANEEEMLNEGTLNPEFSAICQRNYFNSHYGNRIAKIYSQMRFLDMVPDRAQQPSDIRHRIVGDKGEHLPAVLRFLCEDEQRKKMLIEWLHELTPMDVEDFEFPVDPSGKVHLILKERRGNKVPALAASDGTLRFIAMLAALLTTKLPALYFFEEIEKHIHPSRLHLLVELIETQTSEYGLQVVATTHSPHLIAAVNDETFGNMSVIYRREDTNCAIIRPVSGISNAIELRQSQGLSRLLAGGWMENALAFTEDDGNSRETPG